MTDEAAASRRPLETDVAPIAVDSSAPRYGRDIADAAQEARRVFAACAAPIGWWGEQKLDPLESFGRPRIPSKSE